jgi:hypothetical protein
MTKLELEILAISSQFKISAAEIRGVLNESIEIIMEKKKLKKELALSSFDNFESEYVLAKNLKEEILVMKKFSSLCTKANDCKILFDLCPEEETGLRNKIIHEWIILSKDLSELREPKRLVEKNSPDSELAYQRYKKLFF